MFLLLKKCIFLHVDPKIFQVYILVIKFCLFYILVYNN